MISVHNIAETTANVCTHVFELNVLDDKKNSWCAPRDCTGKVFVKIRELNRNHQDTSDLSYADVEHFLRFVDKYVSQAVRNKPMQGGKNLIKPRLSWMKSRRWTSPTLFWCMKTARMCGKKS